MCPSSARDPPFPPSTRCPALPPDPARLPIVLKAARPASPGLLAQKADVRYVPAHAPVDSAWERREDYAPRKL